MAKLEVSQSETARAVASSKQCAVKLAAAEKAAQCETQNQCIAELQGKVASLEQSAADLSKCHLAKQKAQAAADAAVKQKELADKALKERSVELDTCQKAKTAAAVQAKEEAARVT